MKRSGLLLLVAASLSLTGALAATRPHYGGTLRVVMRDAPISLDPADSSQPDSLARRSLSRMIFDTLVRYSDAGVDLVPDLATAWQSSPDATRFTFHLRRDVA